MSAAITRSSIAVGPSFLGPGPRGSARTWMWLINERLLFHQVFNNLLYVCRLLKKISRSLLASCMWGGLVWQTFCSQIRLTWWHISDSLVSLFTEACQHSYRPLEHWSLAATVAHSAMMAWLWLSTLRPSQRIVLANLAASILEDVGPRFADDELSLSISWMISSDVISLPLGFPEGRWFASAWDCDIFVNCSNWSW